MSFDNLVHRISPTLKRITKRLNGHFSYFNDEDLYQEALTHLWVDFKKGVERQNGQLHIAGVLLQLRNYLRKVQDNVTLLSFNAPVGEDGGWKSRCRWMTGSVLTILKAGSDRGCRKEILYGQGEGRVNVLPGRNVHERNRRKARHIARNGVENKESDKRKIHEIRQRDAKLG